MMLPHPAAVSPSIRSRPGFAIVVAAAALAAPSGAALADPPAGQRWEPIPELTDEFEGKAIDPAKWHDCNPEWKGREPGWFSPKNVTVEGGEMRLAARAEALPDLPAGYHTFTTAAVKSKALVRYGYFEVRCRAMDSRASSAFWFYRGEPDLWTEIDVFEIGGRAPGHEKSVHTNVHVFRTPKEDRHWDNSGTWEAPERLADGYHIYGLEWDERKIAFYFDGKLLRSIENTHWHQPLHMNFDSETMPEWFGLPDPKELPAVFAIDWVRSWRRAPAPGDVESLDPARVPRVEVPPDLRPGVEPIDVKVLVLEFNPWIAGDLRGPSERGAPPRGLRETAGWSDPLELAWGYMQDLAEASKGLLRLKIVRWDVVRRFQKKVDGFAYTPESFLRAQRGEKGPDGKVWHHPDALDYEGMIREFDLARRVDAGEFDEVWMMGMPYFGYWESCMAGPGAFEINGGVYDQVPSKRRFAIMGFNVERGVDCMLEDLCHRAEATMTRIYGGWKADDLSTTWARFAANTKQSGGTAGVGSCHYPPNGESDYDFANPRTVQSTAEDWLLYPDLKGETRPINRDAWAGPHRNPEGQPEYHRNYIRWWFAHFPKAPGVGPDGRRNDWWEYLFRFERYDERGRPLAVQGDR